MRLTGYLETQPTGAVTMCENCLCGDFNLIVVDFGEGPYEYGGATGIDRRPVEVTECCEANVLAFSDWEEAFIFIYEKLEDFEMKQVYLEDDLHQKVKEKATKEKDKIQVVINKIVRQYFQRRGKK
jgi:hypothetical protein